MDKLAQPVKIFFVPELIKGTGQNGTAREWHYQYWFVDFFQEYREDWVHEIAKFDVAVSNYAIDSNSDVVSLKIIFYNMQKYTEFCLRWM